MKRANLNRRTFVSHSTAVVAGATLTHGLAAQEADRQGPFQAMGTRVGEVSDDTAIVWTRLTAAPRRLDDGVVIAGLARDYRRTGLPEVTVPVDQLEGACPGAPGYVRLRYGVHEDLRDAVTTPWQQVTPENDFIHQFQLSGLTSGQQYYYESEATDDASSGDRREPRSTWRGKFHTAPEREAPSEVRFCVMTCQGYPDRGHPDGHGIYPSMLSLQPHFACLSGDLVYYDNDMPRAVSPRLARYHWERMFSLPRLVEFNSNVNTYWLKDDHDTLNDDSWPGQSMGTLTFAEGQRIFRQQAPLGDGPSYRTFRWGRDLQIWLSEGRDHRSPNKMPDGPEKTIWGKEQKAWFKQTVQQSSATWKVLISPTPLVGPDRDRKNDNHSNATYQHEGDELRGWLQKHVPDNFFVVCGDRHWQYHSVHPKSGVQEFSVGAASDEHAGGTPGEDKTYHRFHRVKGGFLSVTVKPTGNSSTILFELRDVQGNVVYQWSGPRTLR